MSLFSSDLPKFEKPDKRTQDIQIDYPVFINDSLIYKINDGYTSELINDTLIESKYGKYSISSNIKNNDLLINKQLIIYKDYYTLNEYLEFYNFINTVRNIERKNPIVFTKE